MKKGFTLLELLVVISIIGILMAIGTVSFTTVQRKSRDSRRQADMKEIQKALEQCYAVDGKYPSSVTFGSALTCTAGQKVMDIVPLDPKNSDPYTYAYTKKADFSAYCVCSRLEDIGTGNASGQAAGVCTFGGNKTYFCMNNLQ